MNLRFLHPAMILGAFSLVPGVLAHAQAAALRVSVPFTFSVGMSQLPAGEYTIRDQAPSGILFFESTQPGHAIAVLGTPGGTAAEDAVPGLIFSRRDGDTRLVQIRWSDKSASMLPDSKPTAVMTLH